MNSTGNEKRKNTIKNKYLVRFTRGGWRSREAMKRVTDEMNKHENCMSR